MSGDPAVKDRLEKALAEVGLGYVIVDNRFGRKRGGPHEVGWTLWWHASNSPDPHLLWRAWRLALAGTEHGSCCERCYVENLSLPPWERSTRRLASCANGDCRHGNQPGDFDRSTSAAGFWEQATSNPAAGAEQ